MEARGRMFSGMTTSLGRQRRFLGTLVREPLSVGAVAPSSRRLANHMVADIRPGSRVIELGAGTGALTRAILDSGVAPADFLVIEQNEAFSEMLRERFPQVAVTTGSALNLDRHAAVLPGPPDFVVSGLPLLLFSAGRKLRLLSRVFSEIILVNSSRRMESSTNSPTEGDVRWSARYWDAWALRRLCCGLRR